MSDARASRFTRRRGRRMPSVEGPLFLAVLGVAALFPTAVAVATPSVPDGFTLTSFAAPPVTSPATTGADDVTRLDGHDFVGFNNGVPKTGPTGTGAQNSTVVEYDDDGAIAATFSVRGRVDGLGADAANHRVIVTTNEDGNSTIHTLEPSAATPVVDYTYSPTPSASSDLVNDNTLHTGGGTDAVQVIDGKIYLAASNPNDLLPSGNPNPRATATFQVTLSQSGGVNTATLAPTFPDDATAKVGRRSGERDTRPDRSRLERGSAVLRPVLRRRLRARRPGRPAAGVRQRDRHGRLVRGDQPYAAAAHPRRPEQTRRHAQRRRGRHPLGRGRRWLADRRRRQNQHGL